MPGGRLIEQDDLGAARDGDPDLKRALLRIGQHTRRNLAGGAEIILLDEPTAGMSHAEAEHAVALIRKISEGRTLVMIEHDMSVVFDLADRISVLVYGQIIASDAPPKIKANAEVQQAYLGTVAA